MSTVSNNLDLKDSAIIGNLGAVELTGSSNFLKEKCNLDYYNALPTLKLVQGTLVKDRAYQMNYNVES